MGQHHRLPHIFLELGSGKEVASMNFVVTLDWKFVVALGVAVGGIILCAKMEQRNFQR